MRLFIVAVIAVAHSSSLAWTSKEYTGGSHFSEGGETTPLSEENYSYFYCDSDIKAGRAVNGDIDWRQQSTGDYCIFKHRNRPNNFHSGWERSRLTNGCRMQLEMFNNSAYQCWDFATDGGGNATSDQLNQQKQAAYKAWQDAYRDRLKVVIERMDPLRRGLVAEIAALDADSARFDAAIRQDQATLQQLISKLENLAAEHERFASTIRIRQTQFETLLERLKIAMSNDSRDLQRVQQWTTSMLDEAMAPTATQTTLRNLEDRHNNLSTGCTLRVCSESRAARELRSLRDFQAITWSLLDAYSEAVHKVSKDLTFEEVRKVLEVNVSRAVDAVAKMDQVFSPSSEIILSDYPTCQSWARIPGALRLRGLLAQVNSTNDALGKTAADFEQRWVALSRQSAVTDGIHALRRKALGLAGEFALLLSRGQVSDAVTALSTTESLLALDLNELEQSGLYRPDEIAAARDQIEQLLRPMREDGKARLTLVGGASLVGHRLEDLEIEIFRTSDLAASVENSAYAWEAVRRQIYQTLDTKVDAPLYRPALHNFDELIAYDRKIAAAFDMVNSFRHEREIFP